MVIDYRVQWYSRIEAVATGFWLAIDHDQRIALFPIDVLNGN